jgi:hypothetical protein
MMVGSFWFVIGATLFAAAKYTRDGSGVRSPESGVRSPETLSVVVERVSALSCRRSEPGAKGWTLLLSRERFRGGPQTPGTGDRFRKLCKASMQNLAKLTTKKMGDFRRSRQSVGAQSSVPRQLPDGSMRVWWVHAGLKPRR